MLKYIFLLMLCFLLPQFTAMGQGNLAADLDKVSITFNPEENGSALLFLDTLLAANQLLALGESSHGTSDFFASKSAIIKYCVLKLNYKSIGIEADLAGTQKMNTYLSLGTGTLREGLYAMGIAAWMTEEMKELMEWLRAYNARQPREEQVIFWGFDMQSNTLVCERLQTLLEQSARDKGPNLAYLDSMKQHKSLAPAGQEAFMKYTNSLFALADGLSGSEKQEVYELLHALQQNLLYKTAGDVQHSLNIRDSCMARNIQVCMSRYPMRTIIWAHNEHIAKSKNYKNWRPMGSYLESTFGNTYYALGLLTEKGYVGFYNFISKRNDSLEIRADTEKNSYDRLLGLSSKPDFFIDLSSAMQAHHQLKELFSQRHVCRTIDLTFNPERYRFQLQNNYFKESLYQKFDGIVFIKHSHAAKPLTKSTE